MGRVTIGRAESCKVNLPALTASSLVSGPLCAQTPPEGIVLSKDTNIS